MKKTITLVSTSRADWSYVYPLARAISQSRHLKLRLIATGGHFMKAYGHTIDDIYASGFKPDAQIRVSLHSDSPADISRSLGQYMAGFAQDFSRHKTDVLVLFGDRPEILSIALSAVPFNIPIAHVGGGDITQGAIDELIRHAMTKLSHVHFVSTAQAYANILRMGEEKWRVHQTGSLANDSIKGIEFLTIEDIRKLFPAASKQGYFLVTQHPETMARAQVATQINAVLTALKGYGLPVVFTYPNLDAANKTIIKAVENFVGKNKNSLLIKNAGRQLYYSLVKHAAAVVGNSSSGIYDTPYLKIPAVNIGHRQDGRLKAANVIDVGYDPAAIQRALKKSASPAFHASLDHAIQGFFGRGDAASQMVRVFEGLGLDKSLLIKKFVSTGKSHRV